jgi:polar amino acid transport system substrate-binding protein
VTQLRPDEGRPPRRRPRAAVALAAAAGAVLFLVTGCAASPAPAVPVVGGAEPSPAGVLVSPPPSAAAADTDTSCHPLESLRPSGPLPAPGHMPAGSAMAAIQKQGKLIVGVDQTIYLFGYRDPQTGQLQGFDIDMARAIAQAIFGSPDKIEFKAITSNQRIPDIRNGSVDLVADSMTMNCTREQSVDFSTDYFNAGERVLVPKSSPVRSIRDLGGQKVCAAAGSDSIGNIQHAPSRPIAVSAQTWTDCLVMLEQGQVAAISTDDTLLAGLQAQDPQTHLVGPPFTQEPYGLAVSKKWPSFVRFINAVLQQMRTDGRWTALYREWMGKRLGPVIPKPPPAQYRDR